MAGATGKKRAAHEVDSTETKQPRKRLKGTDKPKESIHPLLGRVYPNVQTLRAYLISKLPSSSRLRRKKLTSLGSQNAIDPSPDNEIKTRLCHLLDTTLVTSGNDGDSFPADERKARWQKWVSFSQNADESHVTLSDGHSSPFYSQSEVRDILIRTLGEVD